MGWKGALRSIAAENRRYQREQLRRAREAERQWKAAQKAAAAEVAKLEVEAFEALIEELVSIHREPLEIVNWYQIKDRPQPIPPEPPKDIDRSMSSEAKRMLDEHKPGFFERLLKLKGPRRRLEEAYKDALALERGAQLAAERKYEADKTSWENACQDWREGVELAAKVIDGDLDAYQEVIGGMGCFNEIAKYVGNQNFRASLNPKTIEVSMRVKEDDIVPAEQRTLTARMKMSKKKMPAAKRMEIYQDYVCGAALRVARELLAALPIGGVLVHVESKLLDTSTGVEDWTTVLSAYCPREKFQQINWERVDASDLVGSLLHSMKMKRGKNFERVERVALPPV